jgi:crotonobetainyl-CoA:carnitine CoA-transferase CaiB-like acyl-CoA transferase
MARIIDLTSPAAAYATRLLVETGHDVVRVEPRDGDEVRRMGPFLGESITLETGAVHQFTNAGKRSFTADVTTEEGQRLLLELVATADVVIASLPLPVDENRLMQANPKLILVRVDDGDPEICAYARSGLLTLTGHPGERPTLMGGHVPYAATGLHVAVATATAMLAKQMTGEGQTVDVSVADCLIGLAEQGMTTYAVSGEVTERRGYRGAVTAVSGAFPTADGFWMLSVPHSPERWAGFMEWVQDPQLADDPSLIEEMERQDKREFILERLDTWSKQHKKDELVTEAQRRHMPSAPITTPFDLAADAQLVARGFLKEIDHPDFGRILFPIGSVANLWGTDPGLAPRLGQHNAEILTELGYSPAEHQALVESSAL